MNWNKLRKQLEGFLNPALEGIVTYSPSGYRYAPDKKSQCYILVNKIEVLNKRASESQIIWYETEMDIKKDQGVQIHVSHEEILALKEKNANIPEDRLLIIAKKNKLNDYAKSVFKAQQNLFKTDFQAVASTYLKTTVDESLMSDDILLNIFAITDRRVGKGRLKKMKYEMALKHPAVQYFYMLRLDH